MPNDELNAEAWFQKGSEHGEKREYDDAIYCYSQAIRLKPDYAMAYNNQERIGLKH
jgi:tetratricopeptide (TPR) repeat protein